MTRARPADGGERLLPADIRTGFLRTGLTTCDIIGVVEGKTDIGRREYSASYLWNQCQCPRQARHTADKARNAFIWTDTSEVSPLNQCPEQRKEYSFDA